MSLNATNVPNPPAPPPLAAAAAAAAEPPRGVRESLPPLPRPSHPLTHLTQLHHGLVLRAAKTNGEAGAGNENRDAVGVAAAAGRFLP